MKVARWGGALHRLASVVLVVGLVVTAGLTVASHLNYLHNEHRLITYETRLTAAALGGAETGVEERLGRATSLVAGGAGASYFDKDVASSLGKGGSFSSVELFEIRSGVPRLRTSLGHKAMLPATSPRLAALSAKAVSSRALAVTWVRSGSSQSLGYALASQGPAGTFVAYAEQPLPSTRYVTLPANSPVGNVLFALYFGRSTARPSLLETNSRTLPLGGTHAMDTVSFGDEVLTLVLTPRGSLEGSFAEWLAWGIAGVGTVLTIAAVVVAERLTRRRLGAEALASENRELYQAQRSVAEALQRSLLPERLPTLASLEVAERYLPGTVGIEVGGDWYDVVVVDERHVFFTVGDVAGRGLLAATVMASLRHAMTAYAFEGSPPDEVLAKVSRLIGDSDGGRFATVLCGKLDLVSGELILANAGHPSPLLVEGGQCRLLETTVGPPVGVGTEYVSSRIVLHEGSKLVAYTDGLVEHRDEPIDAGIARLCEAVSEELTLEDLLDSAISSLVPLGSHDDVAMLALMRRA